MKKELKHKIEEKLLLRPVSHNKNTSTNNYLNFTNNNNTNNNNYANINLITDQGFGSSNSIVNNVITNPAEVGIFRGKIEDYKIIKEIGKGAYAVVKSAIHKATGVKYAIKIYEKYKLMDPAKKTAVKREIQILKQIDHKNIVKMYEVIDAPKQVYEMKTLKFYFYFSQLIELNSVFNFSKNK